MDPQSTSPLSITLCITELDVGGAEKALVQIAVGLQLRNWNVRVVSLRDKGKLAEALESAGITVVALNCGGLFDLRAFWRLRSELRRHSTDVLLSFLHQANIYGRMAGKSAGIPIRVSGIRVSDRRCFVTLPERMTRCCVNHYVAVSEHVAATHAELCRIPAWQISAIPNGVHLPTTTAGAQRVTDKYELLFVGRLTDQKDPLSLLNAFRQLPEAVRTRTKLTLVGEGPLRGVMEDFVAGNDLHEQVAMPGQRSDVFELMRKATLLVLPSKWEGMPNVVLEAMAHGLPVVATSVDGTCELIEDERTGWLVPPGEPKKLAEKLVDILSNSERRLAVTENAKTRVAKCFRWDTIVGQYDDLLRALVSDRPSDHTQ